MSRRRNPSRTRDAEVIQFPVERTRPSEDEWPVPHDVEPTWPEPDLLDPPEDVDLVIEVEDPTEECEGCGHVVGSHADNCPLVIDPTEYVGMTAYSVRTMCRWMHRHMEDGLTEPQPCCYSVLVTMSRLPGPVQDERNWLAYAAPQDDPA